MDKYPAEVSGGEKQRTAVARALMNQPYVILADRESGQQILQGGDRCIFTGKKGNGRNHFRGDP